MRRPCPSKVPPELSAPILAHELDHRSRRWLSPSLEDEAFAHKAQGRVWEQLRDKVDPNNLSAKAREIYEYNERVYNTVKQRDVALHDYLKTRYRRLPESSKPLTNGAYIRKISEQTGR